MILEAKTSPPPRLIPLPKVNSQGRGLPFPSPLLASPKLTCLKEDLTHENMKLPVKNFSSRAAEEQAEVCTIPAELEATAKDTSS